MGSLGNMQWRQLVRLTKKVDGEIYKGGSWGDQQCKQFGRSAKGTYREITKKIVCLKKNC